MKYIYNSLFAVLAVFISCTNPKVKIVERQKAIRKDIKTTAENIKQNEEGIAAIEVNIEWERYHMVDTAKYMQLRRSLDPFYRRKDHYDSVNERLYREYDSLEMELKKY